MGTKSGSTEVGCKEGGRDGHVASVGSVVGPCTCGLKGWPGQKAPGAVAERQGSDGGRDLS